MTTIDTERSGFLWLDRLDDAVKRHAYDCDCQIGGVDAMSIDTDWLQHAAAEIRHAYRDMAERTALAEARATRAEAQSAIRGRAVTIYQQRARDAEAERDEWRQTALDERGAALDALEQIKARDKRIQAVQHLVDQADHAGNWTVTCTHLQRAIDGTTPNPYRASETA